MHGGRQNNWLPSQEAQSKTQRRCTCWNSWCCLKSYESLLRGSEIQQTGTNADLDTISRVDTAAHDFCLQQRISKSMLNVAALILKGRGNNSKN